MTAAVPSDRTSNRSAARALTIAAALAGVMAAVALLLWARYGSAVFYEMVVAGIALCF